MNPRFNLTALRTRWLLVRGVSAIGVIGFAAAQTPADIGPDVIVGDVHSVGDYGRLGDTAALSMATVSCNAGSDVLGWLPLPNNQHPLIAQNMYRLLDGRLEHIGQSWLKHGYAAIQTTFCYSDCEPVMDGSALGVHCSDPYNAGINQGPNLGPRSEVNPVTGFFNGATANNHAGHVHTTISHGLQVKHTDLAIPGARYFVEAHYVTPDDALAGNGNNNASHREVTVTGDSTNWTFDVVADTVRETPAVFAWTGSTRTVLDSWPEDGRIIVAHKVTALGGGQFRFDYGVYNMNSERGVGSFAIPVGAANIRNVGFHAVLSHDEGLSNDPWSYAVADGTITWTTESFAVNPNANAIRWGTLYNFWFEADSGGVGSSATLSRFKPGSGSTLIVGWVRAPAPGDCNGNGIPDDQDVSGGTSLDCNANGLPDECELQANDCNQNVVPDDCDLTSGTSLDCNANALADECDIASGRSSDCNGNSVPDECEAVADCNLNGLPDDCELIANDCDANLVPDECQNDCDRDGTIDACTGQPDCNNNQVPDSCDVLGLPGGVRSFDSGLVGLAIPDGDAGGVTHTLSVPTGGDILDVNVEIEINHSWISDLRITLQHEDTVVVLWDAACGSADNLNAVFDDQGVAATCGFPTTGVIRPDSVGGGMLADFMGQDARGDWVLKMADTIATDAGTLLNWRLLVDTVTIPPTSFDVNHSLIPDECEGCSTAADCPLGNSCTSAACTDGLCYYTVYPYGDINSSGVIDIDDLVCLLDGFSNPSVCPAADIFPCEPDGIVDVDDLLAGLNAFSGVFVCCAG